MGSNPTADRLDAALSANMLAARFGWEESYYDSGRLARENSMLGLVAIVAVGFRCAGDQGPNMSTRHNVWGSQQTDTGSVRLIA